MGVKKSFRFRMLVVIILLSFLSQTALAQTGPSQAPGDSGASGAGAAPEAPAGGAPGEGAYPGFEIPDGQGGGPSEGVSDIEIGPEDIFPTQLGEEEAPPEIIPPPMEEEEEKKTGTLPEKAGRLGRFGYDLFRRPPSTFAPIDQVPIGPDYVMGPGDEVRITIWGMVEGQWSVVIDRDGNLRLPRAGVIGAAGLTFAQLQDAIEKAYSRYYTNFEINVTMGRLRSITVYVVGEARRPGTYSISSLSTLINALVASGGPSYAGTLRDIQVKRGGKTVTHFDLYGFLLKGDKTKDVRLMPEDVIFIPRVGTVVGISGNVLRPAYYEVAPNTRLHDLIELAGGLTSVAFQGRVQIVRVENKMYRTAFEGDLINLEREPLKNYALQDGDFVRIYTVPLLQQVMRVSGAVAKPGEFAITPDVTKVSDILGRAGGLLYTASNQAELTRVRVTQEGPITERILINLEKALQKDPSHDIALQANDYLFVRTVPEWALYRTVTVTGEVKYPGTYTVRKGETLSSVIERAGGYTDKAYLKGAIFLRESVRIEQQKSIDEMVDRLERELYSVSTTATATSFTAEESQIVERETQQKKRLLDTLRKTKATGRVVVRLEDPPELLKRTPFDIELEEGDRLHIPKKPQTVQVVGSVLNETSFVFEPYRNHSYYIQKAGGYGVNADRGRVYLLKADGSAVRVGNLKKPPHLEEGDTVVVPEKIQVTSHMRDTAHIIDMVYKVAISAAVVVDALDD